MEILGIILKNIKEDSPVQEVRRGLHWTAVVTKRCGLASTMAQGGCNHGEAGGMKGVVPVSCITLKTGEIISINTR